MIRKTKKKLITVVIPIYKSLKFQKNIINIIEKNYLFTNFILVDDGENFDLFKKININKFENIDIIHNKKNRGVSFSRNIGIKICKTKYITFCDADDNIFISSEILKYLDESVNRDLILCKNNISKFPKKYDHVKKNISYFLNIEQKINLIINYLKKPGGTSPLIHCWGNIYKTQFLKKNNILFNERLHLHEDSLFVSSCMTKTRNIYIFNYGLYKHNISTKNLSHGIFLNPTSFIYHLEKYQKYLNKKLIKNSKILFFQALSYYLSKCIVGLLNLKYSDIYVRLVLLSKNKKIQFLLNKIRFKCDKIPILKKWMLRYPKISFFILASKKFLNS